VEIKESGSEIMTKYIITYTIEKKMYINAPNIDEARYKFNRIDTSADRSIVDIEEGNYNDKNKYRK